MSSIPIASPSLGAREKEQVLSVMEDGQLADGPEVRRFEEEFAAFCDASEAVGTANGTTALHAALRAVGIGPGDRVVTTPFSFVATANAIRHCGAEPVFADIDPETYNLDPDAVESIVQAHDVDAILPVHLYGLAADMGPLLDIADAHDLAVIEDAAQAHGAQYQGQPVGTIGDVGCFSFYPTKNMTTGEGGAIVTDNEDVAARARRFINHGRAEGDNYQHIEVGHNFRMTSIAAAIGRVQLDKLPEYTEARREHANELTDLVRDADAIEVPVEPSDRRHVYHQFTVRCADREAIQHELERAGVGTAVYYPIPIHEQPAYDSEDQDLPESERAAEEVLSLPVHPSLTADQVLTVASAVGEKAAADGGVVDD